MTDRLINVNDPTQDSTGKFVEAVNQSMAAGTSIHQETYPHIQYSSGKSPSADGKVHINNDDLRNAPNNDAYNSIYKQ